MPRLSWIPVVLLGCAAPFACAKRERPVALPTLHLHSHSVPIGGPLDITLSFEISRDVTPFSDDYRVLLRFLFDDGSIMASYDHDPPTPTRRWRAGSRISYSRRIFSPEVPYVGDVVIIAGLYSASGKRLPLVGKDLGDRTYQVGTLKLHAQRSLLVPREGWHPPESPPHEPGWRWTGPSATMTFHNPRRDAVLHLRMDGSPDRFETAQHVSLLVGGRIVRTFEVRTRAVTDHEVPLSAADFGTDREATLAIHVDKTFVPAHTGHGNDTRELGVRVYNVFLEPRF